MDHKAGHRKRVLEKFKNHPDSLVDYELLEAILFFSIPLKDTKELAKILLKEFKSIDGILKNSDKICSIHGIGEKSSVLFGLINKLILHSKWVNTKNQYFKIDSPESVVSYLKDRIGHNDVESFGVVFLDGENKIIEIKELFVGTINKVVIHTRELVKEIISKNASSILVYHNHPHFEELKPSSQDINLTKDIKNRISIIDVELLDHIILSYSGYLSMKNEGYF